MLLAIAFPPLAISSFGRTGLIAEEGPPKLKAEFEKGSPYQSFQTRHPSDHFGIMGRSKTRDIVVRRQKAHQSVE